MNFNLPLSPSWRKKGCYHKRRRVDRAFMDRVGHIYVIDNEKQLVYCFRLDDEKLVRDHKFTFDQFIDCGASKFDLTERLLSSLCKGLDSRLFIRPMVFSVSFA